MQEDPAEFHDDDDIVPDDTLLYRRISPMFVQWSSRASDGSPVVPRQGFQDYPEDKARSEFGLPGACMSVDVGSILVAMNADPANLMDKHGGYGLAAMLAGAMRSLKGPSGEDWAQGIMHDPRPAAPWHAVAYTKSGKKTKGIQGAIARISYWIVEPSERRT